MDQNLNRKFVFPPDFSSNFNLWLKKMLRFLIWIVPIFLFLLALFLFLAEGFDVWLIITAIILLAVFDFLIIRFTLKIKMISELEFTENSIFIKTYEGAATEVKSNKISLLSYSHEMASNFIFIKADDKYYYLKYDKELYHYLITQKRIKNYLYVILTAGVIVFLLCLALIFVILGR